MTHVCFTLFAVCYVVSLLVFTVMVTDLPRKHEGRWLFAWLAPAIACIVLIFPGTGSGRHSSHGFGNPGHLLGWLAGSFIVWVVMCFIIFTVVTRLPSVKNKAHGHH